MLCKTSHGPCRVGFTFTDSFDFPVFPLYITGCYLDRVELSSQYPVLN